ncbi:hypothetical protein Patl1_05535 [Pistacia atlantica]|uniref:Uncharacterized protein n=1 Tax=Pistacia atlantica TaxID=434234 RepID=A0ACC1BUF8_9ROSI|nr:hypothetical protein Patl1_05535 [Pistacia atlantica]
MLKGILIPDIQSQSTSQSLVLLDEVGAGTNPLEGAALGMSLLESFAETGALLTIATTHHGELKTLKYSNDVFENACMEFDEVNLRPTYKILWGVPGFTIKYFTKFFSFSTSIFLVNGNSECHYPGVAYHVQTDQEGSSWVFKMRSLTWKFSCSEKFWTPLFVTKQLLIVWDFFNGRSNAINIAERLGLPSTVVESARKLYGVASAEINEVIIDMERFKQEFQELLHEARNFLMLSRDLHENLLVTRRKLMEHGTKQRYRKMREITEAAAMARSLVHKRARQLRAPAAQPSQPTKVGKSQQIFASNSQQTNVRKSEHPATSSPAVKVIKKSVTAKRSGLPEVGDSVHVSSLGKKGKVLRVEPSKEELVVQVGNMKLKLKLSNIVT